jgi:transposase InsO family protein
MKLASLATSFLTRRIFSLSCLYSSSQRNLSVTVEARQFDHDPSTGEVTSLLGGLRRRPRSMLSDHAPQFREKWVRWCTRNGVEPLYAHPSYPQDKGEVEGFIQNLNREFVYHLRRFPGWLEGRLRMYREWFNHSRINRGIKGYPADLYECNVRNLT